MSPSCVKTLTPNVTKFENSSLVKLLRLSEDKGVKHIQWCLWPHEKRTKIT